MTIEISIWGIATFVAVVLPAFYVIWRWGHHQAKVARQRGLLIEEQQHKLKPLEEALDGQRRAHAREKTAWDTERYRLKEEIKRNSIPPEEYRHLCERLKLLHREYIREMKKVNYDRYFGSYVQAATGDIPVGSPPPEKPDSTEIPYQFRLAQFSFNPYTGEKLPENESKKT